MAVASSESFMEELRKVFQEESAQNLNVVKTGLATLRTDRDPAERQAAVDAMHRAAHTIKGSARAVNLGAVGSICQGMEDIFRLMKKGIIEEPTPADIALLDRVVENLPPLIAAPREQPEPDVSSLVAELAAVLAPASAAAPAPPARDAATPPGPATASPSPSGDRIAGDASSPKKPLRALVIEDSEFDALFLLSLLRQGGYDVHWRRVQDAAALSEALDAEHWDVIFSDHQMPNFDSTEALKIVKATLADVPFIIVSGSIGEDVAVAAMKAGAQDYLMKGNLTRLVAAVDRELQDARDRQARREAEHALLAQKEALRIAREIQEHLFPPHPPAIPGFDIAGATCPAEATGGDYYDFITPAGKEIFIVVGDVSGHGLGPALLMADVRAYLRALAPDHSNVRDMLIHASRLLRDDLGDFRFITMLFAGLSPHNRVLRYINAGHPPGYVLDSAGGLKATLEPSAAALGIAPQPAFPHAAKIRLDPGDIAVFLTDGAIEAASASGEEYGAIRVLDVVRRERRRPAADIIASLFEEVRRFAGTPGLQDDLSAVIIKVHDSRETPP